MSSSWGSHFRITTFGESHCPAVGVVIDGVPPRLPLDAREIQAELDRRRPGQSDLSTPRKEADSVEILSGIENGVTLGTPVALMVRNGDQRPGDYASMSQIPRPSHADLTYLLKYGVKASSGGGRSSARETIGRVAAGAVARKILALRYGIEIVAWVGAVGDIDAAGIDPRSVSRAQVEATPVRCPDTVAAARMTELIRAVRDGHDSVGGVVGCVCRNVPAGWGEPVFDKLEALMAQAMLSLPATKGFEIGSGFAGARLRGSAHNDPYVKKGERLGTVSNNSGGVQGGISNSEPIVMRIAFKPPATIGKEQNTVDYDGRSVQLAAPGRHDPCVVPRAVPIVEAMASLALIELAMAQEARLGIGRF